MNASLLPKEVEGKGAFFHHDGFLMFPPTKTPIHAINVMLRFKSNIESAVLVDR